MAYDTSTLNRKFLFKNSFPDFSRFYLNEQKEKGTDFCIKNKIEREREREIINHLLTFFH